MNDMQDRDAVRGADPTAFVKAAAEQACAAADAGAPAAGDAVSFDVAALAATVDQQVQQGLWTSLPQPPETRIAGQEKPSPALLPGLLEELADDMNSLLPRVRALEAGLEGIKAQINELMSQLAQLAGVTQQGIFLHAKGLDAVRRDLIEDHKAFLAENAFNALIPALERFRTMRAGLNARRNRDTAAQLDAMIEILSLAVRSLGYLPFEPALGEPFDPQRMECVGHRKGSPGVVLGVERPGYASACGVKRAAGVLLASPAEPGRRTRI